MVCSELEAPLVICGKFRGGALVAGCEGVALSHRWCGCGRCRGVSVVGVAVGCDVRGSGMVVVRWLSGAQRKVTYTYCLARSAKPHIRCLGSGAQRLGKPAGNTNLYYRF